MAACSSAVSGLAGYICRAFYSQALGFEVIVEGLESQAQFDSCGTIDAGSFQGYFLARYY